MLDQPQIKYKSRRARPHLDAVRAALLSTHGLVEPAARILQMDPANLRKYVHHYPDLLAIRDEGRAGLAEKAEKQVHEAVEAGERWAVTLSLWGPGGWGPPKSIGPTFDNSATDANFIIRDVNIIAVARGDMIGPDGVIVAMPDPVGASHLTIEHVAEPPPDPTNVVRIKPGVIKPTGPQPPLK